MINLNQDFEQVFTPFKAFLAYNSLNSETDVYMEAYDIDRNGVPINAHPLSNEECIALAKSLANSKELNSSFLQAKSILPEKLLYTDTGLQGFAVWYTKPQRVELNFLETLDIPCGMMAIPALVWKANRTELQIFAIKGHTKFTEDTLLYHAPFFNIYRTGTVCMGTVKVAFSEDCCLEDFMEQWEQYFLKSFFSHMMENHLPIKGNLVQLWKSLAGKPLPFPDNELIKTGKNLKSLLP